MNPAGVNALLHGQCCAYDKMRYVIDDRDWAPMTIGDAVLPGFFCIPLAKDECGAWSSYWMRMDAGALSPQHLHLTTELLVIREGVFTDNDGADYGPGEAVVYHAGSRHTSSTREGCIALVVTRSSSRIETKGESNNRQVE